MEKKKPLGTVVTARRLTKLQCFSAFQKKTQTEYLKKSYAL